METRCTFLSVVVFVFEHMAAISFHWVEFLPSIKTGDVDQKTASVDMGASIKWVKLQLWVDHPSHAKGTGPVLRVEQGREEKGEE